jgi:hypothetical protein
MHPTLNVDDYPQLALLAWSRVLREITEEDAFALYERNWRFVDVDALTAAERSFIDKMTDRYGKGVMNV